MLTCHATAPTKKQSKLRTELDDLLQVKFGFKDSGQVHCLEPRIPVNFIVYSLSPSLSNFWHCIIACIGLLEEGQLAPLPFAGRGKGG